MAEIKPFKAFRYHEKFARRMGHILCPPYDVINPSLHDKLLRLHQYNAVNLELPQPAAGLTQYQAAARTARVWIDTGIIRQDVSDTFYVYEQYFVVAGRPYVRRGFFAAVRIEEPLKGSIKPHEKTLSKPKADRFALLKALKMNTSPIFGFFRDKTSSVKKQLLNAAKKNSLIDVTDYDGVRHRLSSIYDPLAIHRIQQSLSRTDIVIADGHHRYETAWNYLEFISRKKTPHESVKYVLMFLCPLEDKGLIVLPTHRVVTMGENDRTDLISRINRYFSVKKVSSASSVRRIMEQQKTSHAIGVCSQTYHAVITLKNLSIMRTILPNQSPAYRRLDVVILHRLLLNSIDPEHITYVKDSREANRASEKQDTMVFLLPPPSIEDIRQASIAHETMPQKTTYFYPKLATGLVMRDVSK